MLNCASDATKAETECRSTEEMMNKILETNRELELSKEDGIHDLQVMSMDVKALYPSLKIQEVCPIIYQMLLDLQNEDKFHIEDVDYFEVGKYLAITCTVEELEEKKLINLIPKRRVGDERRGRKPGPAYWDNDFVEMMIDGEMEKEQKWIRAREPFKYQKKRMLALMFSKATEISMKNHMYRFDGKLFKQKDGGPIGDELSQAVARLVMIWWDNEFCGRCRQLDVRMKMYTRYVDEQT